MKKIIAVLLALTMSANVLGIFAENMCGKAEGNPPGEPYYRQIYSATSTNGINRAAKNIMLFDRAISVPGNDMITILDETIFLPAWQTTDEQQSGLTSPNFKSLENLVPPASDVRSPGEFEASAGVLVRWPDVGWSSSIWLIYKDLTEAIQPVATLYIVVNNEDHKSSVISYLDSYGITLYNAEFLITSTDSIWIRDYGPNFIWENNGTQALVDLHYYDDRPLDDAFPSYFAIEFENNR